MSKATNARVPSLAIVADAARKTSKQATQKPAGTRATPIKADVPVAKLVTKEDAITLLVPRIANNINTAASAKEALANVKADIKEMQKAGIKIGSAKTEAVAMAFQAAFRACFNSKGQPLSAGTVNNYMSAVRKSLNENIPFQLNTSRAKAKATAKKASKTTWATHGEVIAALAKAILSVKNNCTDTLWQTAMANCPADMDDVINDFLDAQEISEETE